MFKRSSCWGVGNDSVGGISGHESGNAGHGSAEFVFFDGVRERETEPFDDIVRIRVQ